MYMLFSVCCLVFFFFKQKTAYELRIGDWSSDVCSSDLVIRLLLLAAAVGFAHRAFHAAGDAVGVEDDAAVDVARGAADRLDEAGLAAQETLLVDRKSVV